MMGHDSVGGEAVYALAPEADAQVGTGGAFGEVQFEK